MNEQTILDKTPDILIPTQKFPKNELNNQYLLTKFPFDPTKQSPPNNFLLKLTERLNRYGLDNFELIDA
jgi:hypothetical protein